MLTNGEGKQATATATTARWDVSKSGANALSVANTGSDTIYVLSNISNADFNTSYTAGKTIPVSSGYSYVFNGDGATSIASVAYRCADGETTTVDFAAF